MTATDRRLAPQRPPSTRTDPTAPTVLEKWFHDPSSKNKFFRKWENKIFKFEKKISCVPIRQNKSCYSYLSFTVLIVRRFFCPQGPCRHWHWQSTVHGRVSAGEIQTRSSALNARNRCDDDDDDWCFRAQQLQRLYRTRSISATTRKRRRN